ncbi:GntR family transcriptional regulator [Lysinibacillus piscis]|uniref:GntR family transcriptional regulator n=1 Tax=Lysinibacillus piscis TaxID=2518931 RepID=A0ABQ5NHS7_9BACI|nr:GntR family transcriptional regulator [Lysinibacillus sp. KH24]GLC87648.1 GntR family transcriptional regulator [Lysinibacillus sp. KH24]
MKKTTLEQTAYTSIREKIISGHYMPQTILSETEIANELNMSRTPIRSALSRLESEGYTVTYNGRGILVKDITHKEHIDTLEVIYAFQSTILHTASDRGISFDLIALEELLNLQITASTANDYRSYIEHNLLFIQTFIAVANNEVMNTIVSNLKDRIITKSVTTWKVNPSLTNYRANKINTLLLEALKAQEYKKAAAILEEASAFVKEQLINNILF